MNEHAHAERVPGCFRCDLTADELGTPAPVAPDEARPTDYLRGFLDAQAQMHEAINRLMEGAEKYNYLSPAEVEARVRAGKAAAWDEGYEAFRATNPCRADGVAERGEG